jgi:syntaxin 1B/2/3
MFQDLSGTIEYHAPLLEETEKRAEDVLKDTEGANKKITSAIGSARRSRKLKWILFFIVLITLIIIGGVLAILIKTDVIHLGGKKDNNSSSSSSSSGTKD